MVRVGEKRVETEEYVGPERRQQQPEGWRFTKEISISNVLALAALVVGLFSWGQAMERRIIVLEERVGAVIMGNQQQDRALEIHKAEEVKAIERLEGKLDALLDRVQRGAVKPSKWE